MIARTAILIAIFVLLAVVESSPIHELNQTLSRTRNDSIDGDFLIYALKETTEKPVESEFGDGEIFLTLKQSVDLSERLSNESSTFEPIGTDYDDAEVSDEGSGNQEIFFSLQEPDTVNLKKQTNQLNQTEIEDNPDASLIVDLVITESSLKEDEPTSTTTTSPLTTVVDTVIEISCMKAVCHPVEFLSQLNVSQNVYQVHTPPVECRFGRKKDRDGCDTCDCLRDVLLETCEEPICVNPCYYGSYTDSSGCDTCACKPRPLPRSVYECPGLDCPSCDYGSIKDEFGCETCVCYRPNARDSLYPCPSDPVCPFGPCLYGSVLNDFGCLTCDCLKSTEASRSECKKERCPPCKNGESKTFNFDSDSNEFKVYGF